MVTVTAIALRVGGNTPRMASDSVSSRCEMPVIERIGGCFSDPYWSLDGGYFTLANMTPFKRMVADYSAPHGYITTTLFIDDVLTLISEHD
jgi:hypothetical protein